MDVMISISQIAPSDKPLEQLDPASLTRINHHHAQLHQAQIS